VERVLITGGASGIGKAIADRCRADGLAPVIIDRIAGPDTIVADMMDRESTQAALFEALASGPITRLVNNVGAVFPADARSQTLDEYNSAYRLNLETAAQCLQALLPGMTEAGFGRVVNMSSRAALGKELRSAYAATKAGLIGMTRVWALELGALGITVNAIGPGPIATELFLKANPMDSPRTRAIIDGVPVKRIGQPEDVANAAAFFLGADSGFVTGQVLYVCGGLTVGRASV
jgi:3-oxoacyl-[acyl-carrier protein] reductase